MAAHQEPDALVYAIQTDEDRRIQARTTVHSAEMFIGSDPIPNGIFDPAMGTTDMSYNCNTCGEPKKRCPGHGGGIELAVPVLLPIAVAESRKWLKVTCPYCSSAMFDPNSNEKVAKAPPSKKLAVAAATFNAQGARCPRCNHPHPKVVKAPHDKFSYILRTERENDKPIDNPLYPFQLARIFEGISDEVVHAFGRDPANAHPKNFIIRYFQVPPVSIRPAVRMMGPGGPGSSCHDINSILQYIINSTTQMSKGSGAIALPAPGDAISSNLISQMDNLQQLVFDFMQGGGAQPTQKTGKRGMVSGTRPLVSIGGRFPRKTGRTRKHLWGKRVWVIARDTISGQSQIPIGWVGIPESFARSMQIVETVHPDNQVHLMKYFLNGRRQYPGATRVWRASTCAIHDVEELRSYRLEPGDRLYRDMVNGDYALFNRQPSLERSSINVHQVMVLRNLYAGSSLPTPPRVKTFQFNVVACPLFNADFDGDEMNLVPITHPGPQAEAEMLGRVHGAFISTKSSGPVLGMIQDSTVGSMLLSQTKKIDKLHAMMLYEQGDITPDFSDMNTPGATISGREAISRLLRMTPISLTRRPTWYSEIAENYINFDPIDTKTVIRKGNLVSGVLDKATVGGGARGGVFHQISRIYGPEKAIRSIFALQQMAITHLDLRGFSVGACDMLLPTEANNEIREIIQSMLKESELISKKLEDGKIMPPLGMTIREYYEQLQIEALKVPDTVLGPVLKSIDPDSNGLIQMISTGSKGNYKNVINIMGLVGQITINTRRITGRLAYFPRGDMSPEAHGFIQNNYINGLLAREHYFGSMNGRNDLTNKALSTASTGYANRKSIMACQSSIVDALRMVFAAKVIQVLYGEDGMDARQIEPIEFRSVMLSDAELVEKFGVPELAKERWHAAEMETLKADRDGYRNVFLTSEQCDFSFTLTSKALMAVNVREIAESTFLEETDQPSADAVPDADTLLQMHKAVGQFCEDAPYLLLNSKQKKLGKKPPDYMRAAVEQFCRVVRLELGSAQLKKYRANPELLQVVFDAMRIRYERSLISPGEAVGILAAQAISEFFTQYMLDSHHRSVSGGTNKSGIVRPQEIMGAQPVSKEKSSEMLIRGLVPGPDGRMHVTSDKSLLQELADSIKLLNLEQLFKTFQVLYEDWPSATQRAGGLQSLSDAEKERFHPDYVSDWKWMDANLKSNPLLKVPSDLTSWCFRFVLDRMKLVIKSISLETIVTRLREKFPNIFVVSTQEGASDSTPDIVLRIYLQEPIFRRTSSSATTSSEKIALTFFDSLIKAPLRGLNGIADAKVMKVVRHRVVPDGKNAGKLERENSSFVIKTVGTNLQDALLHSRVDNNTLVSSSIGDTIKMFGIEAGRAKIISEIKRIMGGKAANTRHLQIYADIMTSTGAHTSFESAGIAKREPNNVMLRAGAHGPVPVFTKAALDGTVNPITGMATPLSLGSIPKLGTNSVHLAVDSDFVAANRQSISSLLAEL